MKPDYGTRKDSSKACADRPEQDDTTAARGDILNTKGKSLGISTDAYDQCRRAEAKQQFRTLCHAPFVSMDFGPQGQINVCNHYHHLIANYAEVGSILEVWNSREFLDLRAKMRGYVIDEERCRHCALQIRTKRPENSFAIEQYDPHPADSETPEYPSLLTFRLHNTCNLACIMCTGNLSSRIRREREGRKPAPRVYDAQFFIEVREVLPHVKHIEFFGGEPFLVREHLKVLDVLTDIKAPCSIYANTNAMNLNAQIKNYVEKLNFKCIAVSIDAVNPDLLRRIRVGIDPDRVFHNLRWLFDLRKRRPVDIVLNVTELRQNWYELPELFLFAAENDCHLHINTCIHPSYCTLYDLPADQLAYVLDYLERRRNDIQAALAVRGNELSYRHLLAMIRNSLNRPKIDGSLLSEYTMDLDRYGTDGKLAVPTPGNVPFDRPETLIGEVTRAANYVPGFGERILDRLRSGTLRLRPKSRWQPVIEKIDTALKGLTPTGFSNLNEPH